MENPPPLQNDVPLLPKKRKYLGLSIFAGIFYALPTLFIASMVSVVVLFSAWAILESNFYQLTVFTNSYDFSLEMGILFGFSLLLAAVPAMLIGVTSGRMVYKRSNQDDSGRRAGFTMLAGSGFGLVGLVLFPVVCYAIYIGIVLLGSYLELQETFIFGLLTGGAESALAAILLICIPSIALVLAYLTALLSSLIVFRRRTLSQPVDENT